MTASTATSQLHLDLALRLHRAAAQGRPGAACLSPVSVASALGVTAAAAAGPTRDELLTALGGDLDTLRADLTAAAGAAEGDTVLAVANTVWTREDIDVRPGFQQGLGDWGDVRPAPFGDPERARRLINADVAETTRDLIPELIPAGAVDAATVAAIVNALYLKASWRVPFKPRRTADRPFRGAGEVPTMNVTDAFGYTAADGWQAVTLPVAGAIEAAVLLPDGDLADAEPDLSAAAAAGLLDGAQRTELDLFLPKFTVRSRVPLTAALGALGVRTMFTRDADFSPLTDAELFVSQVLHEAVLRVDENGFEGAAATGVMMKMAMVTAKPDPITVRVDRPFLFLVRHSRTGAVYFLSRVTMAAPAI